MKAITFFQKISEIFGVPSIESWGGNVDLNTKRACLVWFYVKRREARVNICIHWFDEMDRISATSIFNGVVPVPWKELRRLLILKENGLGADLFRFRSISGCVCDFG